MSINRRDLLRTAAAATLAHAAHAVPLLHAAAQPTPPTPPASFALGIRIFFEGAWLFCLDPKDSTRMRAVTLDMAVPHFFPYGAWTTTGWDDSKMPQLPKYYDPDPPPAIILGANPKAAPDLATLYRRAPANSPFYYLPNPAGNPYQLAWASPGLRVVSIPMPTRIIPAGFRTNVTYSDPKSRFHQPPNPTSYTGVPTTLIFEYEGADQLVFSANPSNVVNQATNSKAHYHFHTAPQADYGLGHGPMMLSALLTLLGQNLATDITLPSTGTSPQNVMVGPDVPTSVDPSEFEIPAAGKMAGTIPTCGSGGILVGP